jgi:hypothetical protein
MLFQSLRKRVCLKPDPLVGVPTFSMFVVAITEQNQDLRSCLCRTADRDEEEFPVIVRVNRRFMNRDLPIIQQRPESIIANPIPELLALGKDEWRGGLGLLFAHTSS